MVDLLVQLALTLDQPGHLVVVHRLAQLFVDLLVLLEQRDRLSASLLDHFAHGFRVVELRLLLQIAHRVSR